MKRCTLIPLLMLVITNVMAVVGGNEVVNPFTVTEVFIKDGADWKLTALAFTRILGN